MSDSASSPASDPTPTLRLVGLPPVVDRDTRVLVLGSFPGAASLAARQYYAHPRNRFWPMLSAVWQVDLVAMPYEERLRVALAHGLGLWDVFASCVRPGSLDSAIRAAVPNDLASLATRAPGLRAVLHNGRASAGERRATDALGVDVHVMPSTSPANAAWPLARHVAAWGEVLGRYDPA